MIWQRAILRLTRNHLTTYVNQKTNAIGITTMCNVTNVPKQSWMTCGRHRPRVHFPLFWRRFVGGNKSNWGLCTYMMIAIASMLKIVGQNDVTVYHATIDTRTHVNLRKCCDLSVNPNDSVEWFLLTTFQKVVSSVYVAIGVICAFRLLTWCLFCFSENACTPASITFHVTRWTHVVARSNKQIRLVHKCSVAS